MNTTRRLELAVALAAVLDCPVHATWPDRATTLMAWIEPGAPYATVAEFGEYLLNLDVIVVVPRTSGALAALDPLLSTVIATARKAGFALGAVERPAPRTIAASDTLAAVVRLNCLVELMD